MKWLAGLSARRILVMAVQPALILGLSLFIRAERGPYWQMRYLDPDYAYLLSALTIAELHAPLYNDHPGLTVQVPGGLLIRAMHSVDRIRGRATPSVRMAVVADPERYLRAMSNAMLGFAALSLFLAAIVAMRLGFSPGAALVMQSSWLLTAIILSKGMRVSPEAAFPVILPWAGLLLAWYGRTANLQWSRRHNIMTGALIAVLIATKLTALAWLALIFLPGTRKAALEIMVAMVGALAVLALPIFPRLRHVEEWIVDIATHEGRYGAGQRGFVDVHAALQALKNLSMTEVGLFIVTAAAAMLLVRQWWMTRGTHEPADDAAARWKRAVLVMLLIMCGTIAMTAKHPANHYLLPAAGVLGAAVVLLVSRQSASAVVVPPWSVLAVALLSVRPALLTARAVGREREWRRETERLVAGVAAVDPACVRVYYYSASSPEYALAFGNVFQGREYANAIGAVRTGNQWTYDIWIHTLKSHEQLIPVDTARTVPCLVLQGTPKGDPGDVDPPSLAAVREPEYALKLFTDTKGVDSAVVVVPVPELLPESSRYEKAWLVKNPRPTGR